MSGKLIILILLFLTFGYRVEASHETLTNSQIKDAFNKLISSAEYKTDYQWPPVIEINNINEAQATSTIFFNKTKYNYQYKIIISKGLLDSIVASDEHLLCFILAHEIAHIVLGHIDNVLPGKNAIIKNQLYKEDEFDADIKAMSIALDAGYNFKSLIKSIRRMIDMEGETSRLLNIADKHPVWSDRLANIDKNNTVIWKNLSTFKNGSTLLSLGYFKPAIFCFKEVLEQYPDCYEAHVNIGYSRLMQYIELLDSEELEKMKIGNIITGLFYSDASSLKEKIRGIDIDLWWEAVAEFQIALKMKPDLTLAHANLGLAYLVSPMTGTDAGRSARYFDEAIKLIDNDKLLDEQDKAIVFLNAGISYLYSGQPELAVQSLFTKASEHERNFAKYSGEHYNSDNQITVGLKYNEAILLMQKNNYDDKIRAIKLFEEFIISSSSSSPWSKIANVFRNRVCSEIGHKCHEVGSERNKNSKKIVGIQIDENKFITLSDSKEKVMKNLGSMKITERKILKRRDLKSIVIDDIGVEILASDYVFAIILRKNNKLKLMLNENEISSYISVGTDLSSLEQLLNKVNYTIIEKNNNLMTTRYYPDLGITVRISRKTNTIEEIAISSR